MIVQFLITKDGKILLTKSIFGLVIHVNVFDVHRLCYCHLYIFSREMGGQCGHYTKMSMGLMYIGFSVVIYTFFHERRVV